MQLMSKTIMGPTAVPRAFFSENVATPNAYGRSQQQNEAMEECVIHACRELGPERVQEEICWLRCSTPPSTPGPTNNCVQPPHFSLLSTIGKDSTYRKESPLQYHRVLNVERRFAIGRGSRTDPFKRTKARARLLFLLSFIPPSPPTRTRFTARSLSPVNLTYISTKNVPFVIRKSRRVYS